MKYLRKHQQGYYYNPPKKAVDAGIVKRKYYKDGRSARYEVPRLNELVEEYMSKGIVSSLTPKTTLKSLCNYYTNSKRFLSLSRSSQSSYETAIRAFHNTNVFRKGNIRIEEINTFVCEKAYEEWLSISVANANKNARVFSIVMNYAKGFDIINQNYMANVKKQKHEPNTPIWHHEEVEKFLDFCFSKFDYRNLGLITLMCYEWASRPIDVRLLKWEHLDLPKSRVKITQEKRGAEVELPISPELTELLKQQKEDFDFQPYVVPDMKPADGAFKPYSKSTLIQVFNEAKRESGLREELKLSYLRKTAINELLEGNVHPTSIMSVTGHKNIKSLNPYVKHRYETAKNALDQRKHD